MSPLKLASAQAIFRALDEAGVRYLVAGGLAVNAHGYLRFTQDVDLVLQLESGNVHRAFESLGALGFGPMVPITADQFADDAFRGRLAGEKGMREQDRIDVEHLKLIQEQP